MWYWNNWSKDRTARSKALEEERQPAPGEENDLSDLLTRMLTRLQGGDGLVWLELEVLRNCEAHSR